MHHFFPLAEAENIHLWTCFPWLTGLLYLFFPLD